MYHYVAWFVTSHLGLVCRSIRVLLSTFSTRWFRWLLNDNVRRDGRIFLFDMLLLFLNLTKSTLLLKLLLGLFFDLWLLFRWDFIHFFLVRDDS